MTQHESAHEDSEDRFYAQFDSREVELMTLDELQAAFEAGQIHENTFVCREGESEWCTLADVAGLGEDEEEAPVQAAPVIETRPPMPSRRPDAPVGETRPPMPARPPEAVGANTRPPMPERRPEMHTVPAARFAQSGAPAATAQLSSGLSYAPVTSNIDYSALDTDDEVSLRPKRRWGLVLAAAAVLAVGGGGAVFALNGGSKALASSEKDAASLEAASSRGQASRGIETKPSEPAPAPVAPSVPEPVVAAPAPEAPSDAPKAATPAFSDDMKSALLAADKTRTDKHAKKVKGKANVAKASAAPRRGKAAASAGFKSGGSAYDPLNGKL